MSGCSRRQAQCWKSRCMLFPLRARSCVVLSRPKPSILLHSPNILLICYRATISDRFDTLLLVFPSYTACLRQNQPFCKTHTPYLTKFRLFLLPTRLLVAQWLRTHSQSLSFSTRHGTLLRITDASSICSRHKAFPQSARSSSRPILRITAHQASTTTVLWSTSSSLT